jgi:NAD(P)-dependent dehydrogenase (short-subunit alcohol dehydrogenase family)
MSILERLCPAANLRVLVTAGAGGMGAAVARALHATGARVHVCDVDRAGLDRLARDCRGLTASMADVAVAVDVQRVIDDVRAVMGGLDVLVCSAVGGGPAGPIEGIAHAGWERSVAENLDSHYQFARRALPLLRSSARGASLIVLAAGDLNATPRASTTWATVGLVKSLASELGPQGIRVNAVLPGAGDAEDAAALALFLCTPAARNVTGQAIGTAGALAPA